MKPRPHLPEELEDEAGHRVERDVGDQDLAVELLARRDPHEDGEDQEGRERLVDLAGMERSVEGSTDVRVYSSVKVTAQGTSAGRPQQQPAARQPSRPMLWPMTTPGRSTSAVAQAGRA